MVEHQDSLEGYTFVLSEPNGSGALHFPARLDFSGGGHFRSVFTHDNLYVINHDVVNRYLIHGKADIRVDYSVAFDANIASYLRAWHKGRSGPVVGMLQSVMRALRAGRFNWDLLPFLLERSKDILDGRDLDKIFETELASSWFSASDRAHFEQTGDVHLTVSADEIARRAQVALATWDRQLKAGMMNLIRERYNLFYACILKMVLLHMENPSRSAAAQKLKRLLEFMHQELRGMFLLIARAGLEFFGKSGSFRPMAKVATPSLQLRKNVRNVTWDFMQLLWRHSLTGFRGREGGLLIPYFLTFDRGLADLYDIYPQRSCLFGNEIEFPLFYAEMDLHALILNSHPELDAAMSYVFSLRGAEERKRHGYSNPSQITVIVGELEHCLTKYENGS